MRTLTTIILLFIAFLGYSQETTRFALQGMINVPSRDAAAASMENIRTSLNCAAVRVDHVSQRFFILIDLPSRPTSNEVKNLFRPYLGEATCIQIQEYGVEPLSVYPFTNCDND